ncbi:MAG: aminopeptidase P family protein [Bacteroidetes bacterium]|nr:aminopeptidase P family protein [Bacteroidota bacterium]
MFQKTTYQQRRNRLKSQVRSGIILLLGNDESPMNYPDNTYHFRQDSSFIYFFGIDFPGLIGIIDIDNGTETIYGNDYTIDDIVWMGSQPTIRERAMLSGVENTGTIAQAEASIKKAQAQNRTIHFLPPYHGEHKLLLLDWCAVNPKEAHQKASLVLIKAIVEQRNKKTAEELAEIDKATILTADMHLMGMRTARPGMTEAEVMAAVNQVALSAGGNLSFPIIATINGQTLHNHYYGNKLNEGRMFLLDAGAEIASYYAGDLSSTFPVGPKFTPVQREIYTLSLLAHEHAVSRLKPGVNFKDIHLSACKVIAEGMKELGFMKGNSDDAVQQGAHAMFFPCGLGHMMGLDIHDMEGLGEVYVGYDGQPKSTLFGLKSLRLARILEPGFVFTIEPGIYFIPELIDKWRGEKKFTEFLNYDKIETYKDFGGCRNEENYLITETGAKLLGKPLPKTADAVEMERQQAF